MPRLKSIQNAFTAGELDPLLRGRTDLKQYFDGLETANNVFLLPQGGAKRRDGLAYIDTLPTVVADGSLSESRCIPFIFSSAQTYKLVFCDLKILVYLGTSLQATVTSPYGTADVSQINYTQGFDTMYLFHKDYAMHKLQRGASHTAWTLSIPTITQSPRYNFVPAVASPAADITPSAVTGTIDITATAAVFTAADVGQFITGNGGRARVLSYTSSTVLKAYMVVPFYDIIPMVAGSWEVEYGYEDAWSATRGYPRCGTFHKGRLFVGGSRDLPMTIWGSTINDFLDFGLGTNLDDEGIIATLQADSVTEINQVFSGRHLQVFTSTAEFFVPSTSPITPNSIEFLRTSSHGSKAGIKVWNVDGATLFLNRTGGQVREFLYDNISQAYNAESLSLLASHMLTDPVDTAFRSATSTEDADYLLVVNSDGTMAVMNTLRTQSVTGWSKIEINGLIKSAGVELDTMYFVVERNINGTPVRYIEYFNANHALDSSILQTVGTPAATFTGLSHLNGETVKVIADGNTLNPVLVSGGSVTIERAATTVEFGLAYKASGNDYTIKTMPIERSLPDGTMIGRKKRIVEVTLLVNNAKSALVNGNRVAFRQLGSSLLDSSTQAFSGQKVIEGMLGFSDEAQVEIGDTSPLPVTILAISYKIAV